MITVNEKIQNACFQLNHDAYILQSKKNKKLREFIPCEKSLILLDCQRENGHFGTAILKASVTHCDCHNSLSESKLFEMCLDDTARLKHYAGFQNEAKQKTNQ